MTFLKGSPSHSHTSPITQDRSKIRHLLRKGGSGNAAAFVQATAYYLDFLSEYFYLIGRSDPNERLTETRKLLLDCWRYAPYIKRVSDLERFLEVQLQKRSEGGSSDFSEPHEKLNGLNHRQRFLLVGRTFQDWTYRSLHLATRVKTHELGKALADLKCHLTGLKPQLLKTHEQALVIRLSECLEGELRTKDAREVEKAIAERFHVLDFKAQWLAYRCELADLKAQIALDPLTVERFKDELRDELKDLPLDRPKLKESLLNQISFLRLPSS